MATKNTLEDLSFAEMYLEFLSRKELKPEVRVRAKLLLATIQMLDIKHPTWRTELLEELDRSDTTRAIEKMFPLPVVDDDRLFSEFMSTVLSPDKDT